MTPIIRPDAGKRIAESIRRDLRKRPALGSFLREVAGAVAGAGGTLYLSGGYLRDLAEGRAGGDVDLMATGISFPRLGDVLRSVGSKRSGVRQVVTAGKHFPVHRVATTWGHGYLDVSSARGFPPRGNASRPPIPAGVEPEAHRDASSRDFTINSLLFRLPGAGAPEDGEFLDLFGGIADLRRRRIRFVGNPADRLREDPLRALRAVRLAGERKRFRIDGRGVAAIRSLGATRVGSAPPDRVAPELVRALAADPAGAVFWLRRLGLLRVLLPELRSRRGAADRAARRYRFLARSFRTPLPTPLLLANLLAELPPGSVTTVLRRLRLPGERKVVALLSGLDRLRYPERLRFPRAETESILARSENLRGLIALYRADCQVRDHPPRNLMRFFARCGEIHRHLDGIWLRQSGFPEGPVREEVLLQVREATLSGKVRSREEAIRLAERMRGEGGKAAAPAPARQSFRRGI